MSLANLVTWFNLPVRYRERHFRRRECLRSDYRLVARALLDQVPFASVVDVGCANGFLLEEFAADGREIAGVELSPDVVGLLAPSIRDHVLIGDFSELEGQWDLACCVEVAEHIPPRRSQELVDTLSRIARSSIYFTAAPPGQAGRGHINCRPHEEWLEMFRRAGWQPDDEDTAWLRAMLARLDTAVWLRGNSFLLSPTAH